MSTKVCSHVAAPPCIVGFDLGVQPCCPEALSILSLLGGTQAEFSRQIKVNKMWFITNIVTLHMAGRVLGRHYGTNPSYPNTKYGGESTRKQHTHNRNDSFRLSRVATTTHRTIFGIRHCSYPGSHQKRTLVKHRGDVVAFRCFTQSKLETLGC